MKKQIVLTALMAVVSLGLYAQEENQEREEKVEEKIVERRQVTTSADGKMVNKKGYVILPEAGDWNVLLDATPFLNYAGNIFTGGVNTAPTFSAPDGVLIRGRYFVRDNFAYRVGVNVGRFTNATRGTVQDDVALAANPDSEETVNDFRRQGNTQVILTAGMEWRRGSKRIQGYWGFDGIVGFDQSFDRYRFGNDINNAFDANVWSRSSYFGNPNLLSARQLDITLGAAGIGGLEYFMAPKLSVGGEFSMNLFWVFEGRGTVRTEFYDNTQNEVVRETNRGNERNGFGGLITNPLGGIFVSFYF